MPITTIADALNSVGTSINTTLQQAAERRRQDLQEQAETNKLTLSQGLLALEAQKAQAGAELGLAKVGAEGRQFDVTSEQKNREILQTGDYQRALVANAAEGNRITARHYENTDPTDEQIQANLEATRTGTRKTASEIKTPAILASEESVREAQREAARAQQLDAETRNKINKFTLDTAKQPIAVEDVWQAGTDALRQKYPPDVAEQKITQLTAYKDALFGDAHLFEKNPNDPNDPKHYGPAALIEQRVQHLRKVADLLDSEPNEPPEVHRKKLEMLSEDLAKDPAAPQDPFQRQTLLTAFDKYPNQFAAVATQIAAHKTTLMGLARQRWQAEHHNWLTGDKTFDANNADYKHLVETTVNPIIQKMYLDAANQITSSRGTQVPTLKLEMPPPPGTPGAPGAKGTGLLATATPLSPAQMETNRQALVSAAQRKGLTEEQTAVVLALAQQESGFDHRKVHDGGTGWGMGGTHAGAANDAGVPVDKLHDPQQSAEATVEYFRQKLAANGGDIRKALEQYNGGGDPHYFTNVMQNYAENKRYLDQRLHPPTPRPPVRGRAVWP